MLCLRALGRVWMFLISSHVKVYEPLIIGSSDSCRADDVRSTDKGGSTHETQGQWWESYGILFDSIAIISRTLCLLLVLCLVSTINKIKRNIQYTRVTVVSVTKICFSRVFFSNCPWYFSIFLVVTCRCNALLDFHRCQFCSCIVHVSCVADRLAWETILILSSRQIGVLLVIL